MMQPNGANVLNYLSKINPHQVQCEDAVNGEMEPVYRGETWHAERVNPLHFAGTRARKHSWSTQPRLHLRMMTLAGTHWMNVILCTTRNTWRIFGSHPGSGQSAQLKETKKMKYFKLKANDTKTHNINVK